MNGLLANSCSATLQPKPSQTNKPTNKTNKQAGGAAKPTGKHQAMVN
jgi:hypothetical protein